jgi:hypothetical protein
MRLPAPALVCTILLLLVAPSPAASQTIVARWNEAALGAVRDARMPPMITARALAILHTSMYDAWAAYDETAVGTRLQGQLRRPAAERLDSHRVEAMSYAAYRALVDLFPAQQSRFDSLMGGLGYSTANLSTDTTTPAGIGNVAAQAVLAFRHHDGSNQLGNLAPGAYSDYTSYLPLNSPEELVDPNRWQPLRQPNGQPQRFLTPHWGLVTPFALQAPGQFLPSAPALFPHGSYRKQVNEVVHLSASLTDRDKAIATYWADGPATETPPGHWALFAQFVSARDGRGIGDDVKMFFALSNAMLDASIAVWECKVAFDYVRPITAVRFLRGDGYVRSWAGPYQGTQLIHGATWQSYIPTPPFAEYVSGHSTFSAASAEILKLATGSDAFGGSVTIPAGWSFVEPGTVPATDIELKWSTFSEAADEAGFSRRLGGIHFEDGDLKGRTMGRLIGSQVWQKALRYFDGTLENP